MMSLDISSLSCYQPADRPAWRPRGKKMHSGKSNRVAGARYEIKFFCSPTAPLLETSEPKRSYCESTGTVAVQGLHSAFLRLKIHVQSTVRY